MIIYDKLWATMKSKGITQYKLIKQHNFSRGQLSRLKHNKNVNTNTLNTLCTILECNTSDIIEYVKDEPLPEQSSE